MTESCHLLARHLTPSLGPLLCLLGVHATHPVERRQDARCWAEGRVSLSNHPNEQSKLKIREVNRKTQVFFFASLVLALFSSRSFQNDHQQHQWRPDLRQHSTSHCPLTSHCRESANSFLFKQKWDASHLLRDGKEEPAPALTAISMGLVFSADGMGSSSELALSGGPRLLA